MTQIRLRQINYGGIRYELPMILHAPKYRIHTPITSLFDTGCPHALVISEGQALTLKIPLSSLKKEGIISLGSLKYDNCQLKEVTLSLRDVSDEIVTVELPVANVLRSTKRTQKALQEAHQFPNLLGLDFLRIAKFSMRTDIETSDMYFERAE